MMLIENMSMTKQSRLTIVDETVALGILMSGPIDMVSLWHSTRACTLTGFLVGYSLDFLPYLDLDLLLDICIYLCLSLLRISFLQG